MTQTHYWPLWREVSMAKLCEHGYFLEVAPRSCPKCRTDLDLIQREEIATLKVTISRLRDALTAAAEQRNHLSSPYDTGWQDAIRWINQQVGDAAMAGGANGN